jgi:hypothetical protein
MSTTITDTRNDTRTDTKKEKLEELKKRLEEKGMAEVKNLHQHQQTGTIIPPEEALMNIMKQGATEFEKETGRKMSYGEMREMYG